MIDVPLPVYIEYKNLSSLVSQAEHQKDLISLVLKRTEGQTKTILEYQKNNSFQPSEKRIHFFLQAKCVVCYTVTADNTSIILSSVKKVTKNSGESAEVYFDTVDLPGKISSWKIELQEVKPILVHSGTKVKIKFPTGNGIKIQSSGKSLKNGIDGEIIRVQVQNLFHKNLNSSSSEVIEAKVTAPNEVEYVGK